MNAGGACIGCTMPGFPDKFTPFYTRSPGSSVSSTASRLMGGIIRPLRQITNAHLNREVRWDREGAVPSAWSREKPEPGLVADTIHRFYDKFRRSGDTARNPGEVWGKRVEATQRSGGSATATMAADDVHDRTGNGSANHRADES
jgi:hydrogenase small subunit